MKAKDARERALTVKANKESQQYSEIMELIDIASSKGDLSVYYYNPILSEVLQLLKADGYKVNSHSDQRDGHTITIQW